MTTRQIKNQILKGYNNLPTDKLNMFVKNQTIMLNQLTESPDYDNEIGKPTLQWLEEQIDYINNLLKNR